MSTPSTSQPLLTDLLRRVSRSFYLTLRVLPSGVRDPIGLAYLLARASDTIADTELLPADQRLSLLDAFNEAVQSEAAPPSMHALVQKQSDDAEAELLRVCHEAIQLLRAISEEDRQLIREVLDIIISGQVLDLQRFHAARSEKITSLEDPQALKDYTYRVAGSVGAFWTRMCLTHLQGTPSLDRAELERLGVRYGQGLQLVNILRDFQKDLSMGRCYLPKSLWESTAWRPGGKHGGDEAFVTLWQDHVKEALACLTDGWQYVHALPTSWIRVRLACAWPILLGVRTLRHLAYPPVPGSMPCKVPRTEVYEIMLRTMITSPLPEVWDSLFDRWISQCEAAFSERE